MNYYNNDVDGMLFSMTNAKNNSIVVIKRDMEGALSDTETYMMNGSGTGADMVDPLGSQGSVILSHNNRFLFAVNAGSNSISSFMVAEGKLKLTDVVSSGGVFPNCLATTGNYLYVANSGDASNPSNITGFEITANGRLRSMVASARRLSAFNVKPGCIAISDIGQKLIVSEKGTNVLSVFQINNNGALSLLKMYRFVDTVPFGSTFLSNNTLIVSEAGPNALSSYNVAMDGALTVVSNSVPNGQKATCWVSVDTQGKHAYTSNAGSGTITDYMISNIGIDGGWMEGRGYLYYGLVTSAFFMDAIKRVTNGRIN